MNNILRKKFVEVVKSINEIEELEAKMLKARHEAIMLENQIKGIIHDADANISAMGLLLGLYGFRNAHLSKLNIEYYFHTENASKYKEDSKGHLTQIDAKLLDLELINKEEKKKKVNKI